MENELNFYLSSHGTTHLKYLLIDKERPKNGLPQVFPIKGIPEGIDVEIHYKIRGRQMQSVPTRQNSISQARRIDTDDTILPHREYSDYMIIKARGIKMSEYAKLEPDYKGFRVQDKSIGIIDSITLMKYNKIKRKFVPASLVVEVNSSMLDRLDNEGMSSKRRKVEPRHTAEQIIVKDGLFYNREKNIAINLPNIEYSYEEDAFAAGLLELKTEDMVDGGKGLKPIFVYEGVSQMKYDFNNESENEEFNLNLKKGDQIEIIKIDPDDSDWLYIRTNGKTKWITKYFVKPKFYTSSAFDPNKYGFLHSTFPGSWVDIKSKTRSKYMDKSEAYEDQSLLNMLFEGGGKKDYPDTLYAPFVGLTKRNILKKGNKYIINIYGSHCLNAEKYDQGFSNVIPFVLIIPEWSNLFQDELREGAKKEVEYYKDLVKPNYEGTRTQERYRKEFIKKKLKDAELALKAIDTLHKQKLGPILPNQKRKTHKLKLVSEPNKKIKTDNFNSNKLDSARIKKNTGKSIKKKNSHKKTIRGRLKNKRKTKRIKKRKKNSKKKK